MPFSLLLSVRILPEAVLMRRDRAFELDFLRGIAILFMITMHISWDLRYSFGVLPFGYIEQNWYRALFHPIFLVIFVGVSGICCTFSRNNLIRGLKLLAVAVALFAGTYIATFYFHFYCLIIFNVIALLTVGIMLYTLISFIEKKAKIRAGVIDFILFSLGTYFAVLGHFISIYDYKVNNILLLPTGIAMECLPAQGDFMPLFPWLGVFLIGCVAGRRLYKDKKTLFPDAPSWVHKISRPFEFMGRHSLIIYLVHQPLIYGILLGVFMLIKVVGGK